MYYSSPKLRIPALLLAAGLACTLPAAAAHAQKQRGDTRQEQSGLSAREAAAIAQRQHGGKVLKVQRQGQIYRVRLLLDNGRVITVSIKG